MQAEARRKRIRLRAGATIAHRVRSLANLSEQKRDCRGSASAMRNEPARCVIRIYGA